MMRGVVWGRAAPPGRDEERSVGTSCAAEGGGVTEVWGLAGAGRGHQPPLLAVRSSRAYAALTSYSLAPRADQVSRAREPSQVMRSLLCMPTKAFTPRLADNLRLLVAGQLQ